jgi:hypothetical protein
MLISCSGFFCALFYIFVVVMPDLLR